MMAQMLVLQAWANDIGPWVGLMDNPWYLFAVWLVLPVIKEWRVGAE
jgi:hypothetical protein